MASLLNHDSRASTDRYCSQQTYRASTLGTCQGQGTVAAGGSLPACRIDRGAVVLSRQCASLPAHGCSDDTGDVSNDRNSDIEAVAIVHTRTYGTPRRRTIRQMQPEVDDEWQIRLQAPVAFVGPAPRSVGGR